MSLVKINCLKCGKEKLVRRTDINRGYGKFCSLTCSAKYNAVKIIHPPNVKCAHCGKEFYKNNTQRKKSRSGLFFCCRKHKDISQTIGKYGVSEIFPDHYGDGTSRYRDRALSSYGAKCNRCGYNENIKAIVVHHKDRDRSNNELLNLEVLCANCHLIEHH